MLRTAHRALARLASSASCSPAASAAAASVTTALRESRTGLCSALSAPAQRSSLAARASTTRGVFDASGLIAQTLCTKGLCGSASLGATVVNPFVNGGAAAERQIIWWLGGATAWVFSMVVLGGVTRLTRSGLSMTDWKFTGETRPKTEAEWEVEFTKYKRSPEYQKVNSSMNLEEFKFIYWLEYGHRMWGRALGVIFAIPCTYFAIRGYIRPALAVRVGVLFLMGGAQGFVGWWMVKSGLEQPKNQYEIPRVSPYRLAAHLTSAFTIYAGLLWTTLSVAYPAGPEAASEAVKQGMRSSLRLMMPLSGLVALTAISGAFVAGLDAGHAYNEFPLMGGRVVPAEYWKQGLSVFENTFENTAAVQFHHRVLATTTLASVATVWLVTRGKPLPAASHTLIHAMLAMTCGQVALGITTLLTHVPVELGAAHQAGALTLMSVTIGLLHALHFGSIGVAGFAGVAAPSLLAATAIYTQRQPELTLS